MKKTIWIVVVVVVVALIAVWFWGKDAKEASGEPIKIGQMSGLSGVGSEIGEEERNGALLAVEEINARGGIDGRPINLISEDTPNLDLKQGASVARKLITVDNVLAIVGPQWDGQGEVVSSIASDQKVPVISPNVSTDVEAKIDSPYFFTTWPKNEVGIRELLRFAKERGWKKIAIVEPANFSFWLFTSNLFEKNAKEFGVEVVAKEMGADYNIVDYRTLILKAKSKKPDAFFGSYADLQCVFLKQSKEMGAELPLLSTESAGTPKTLEECPDLMKNRLFFATPNQSNGYEKFEKSYETRFKKKPLSPSAATSYNAVLALAETIGDLIKSGKDVSRENIKIGLENVEFAGGVSIPVIKFDEKGFIETPLGSFEMQTVKDGEFVRVE